MAALDFLKTDSSIKDATDSLGGFTWDTGLYTVVIDSVYLDQSAGGAHNVNFTFKTAEGKTLSDTIYITSGTAKGVLNYYVDKQGQKQYLPGFTTANDISLVAGEKELSALEPEEKIVEVYNSELKKKVPTAKLVPMELIGKTLQIGIVKVKEFKNIKDASGKYVPGTEIREFNEINKVFADDGRTIVEAKAGAEAEFITKWVTKNPSDFIKDKTGGAKSTPAAGADVAPTKSLFKK